MANEMIGEPSDNWGYVKGGDIAAGLAAGLKGYLGMRGALEDSKSEQQYNDYLAQLQQQASEREQQRYDDQQQLEYYKLAQQGELANKRLLAEKAAAERARAQAVEDRDLAYQRKLDELAMQRQQALADRQAQQDYEQAVYTRNRADTVTDNYAQRAFEENKQRRAAYMAEQAQYLKDLDSVMQKKLSAEDYLKWRENPEAYDVNSRVWLNPKRWFGKANNLVPKESAFNQMSDEDLLKGL